METIVSDGVTYTKAGVLARQKGYTADYLGQLCRAGKVTCLLVGRTWYIDGSSLLTHIDSKRKPTRPAEISNKINIKIDHGLDRASASERVLPPLSKKTRRFLNEALSVPVTVHSASSRPTEVVYHVDSTALSPTLERPAGYMPMTVVDAPIPTIKPILPVFKPEILPVSLEDAVSLPVVAAETRKIRLDAVPPPPVALQGTIAVTEITDPEPEPPQYLEYQQPEAKKVSHPVNRLKVVRDGTPRPMSFRPASVVAADDHRSNHFLVLLLLLGGVGLAVLAANTEAYLVANSSASHATFIFDFSHMRELVERIVFQHL